VGFEAFLTAIDASPGALERPNRRGWIGEYQITGKHGHILADQPGYLLFVTGTVRRWKKAKRALPGAVTLITDRPLCPAQPQVQGGDHDKGSRGCSRPAWPSPYTSPSPSALR
jgi:hypothetical protein